MKCEADVKWNCVGFGLCAYDYLALVEQYPERNQKTDAIAYSQQGGGPVATALATMGRLGMSGVAFVGKVGDDLEGAEIRSAFHQDSVNTQYLKVVSGASSAKAFVWIEQGSGMRSVVLHRDKRLLFSATEIEGEPFNDTNFLLIDGRDYEAALKAAEIATANGAQVVMDAGSLRPSMDSFFQLVHYFVCSKDFVYSYGGGKSVERVLEEIHRKGCNVAVATLGSEGCVAWDGGRLVHSPAFNVDAVDTTGAGDVFHGAFVFGLWKGWDLERILQFANAVAALKCQRLGGRAGIPTIQQVQGFLQEKDPNQWSSLRQNEKQMDNRR